MPGKKLPLPLWRSLLFVPANNDRYVDKAHTCDADAVVLDLEDSVPPAEKINARNGISDAVGKVSVSGAEVMIRINDPLRLAVRDLEAAVVPGVRAIVVPKTTSACQLNRLSEVIAALESERGMRRGGVVMIALIESPHALPALDEIAAVPRVVGMSLGTEDFAAAAGMDAMPEALMGPSQALLFAARRHQCVPYGFVGSIADYSDPQKFSDTVTRARRLGFCGAFAVHPSQVTVMNACYLPTSRELEQAERLATEYAAGIARGRGTFEIDGTMVDKPVLDRALQQLELMRRFAKKSATRRPDGRESKGKIS